MVRQGVSILVTTPHLDASVTVEPPALAAYLNRVDEAWRVFVEICQSNYPNLIIHRGSELLLDSPRPNVADSRVRLGETKFLLVEFPFSGIPPRSDEVLFNLRLGGSNPIVAHPERYQDVCANLSIVELWRRVGAFTQVNAGSFCGRYGDRAKETAFRLLRRGWIDYVSSDYHARGECHLSEAQSIIRQAAGEATADALMRMNARNMLQGSDPVSVGIPRARRGLLGRLFGRGN
jgi:protein-tyrosine phosphatase